MWLVKTTYNFKKSYIQEKYNLHLYAVCNFIKSTCLVQPVGTKDLMEW